MTRSTTGVVQKRNAAGGAFALVLALLTPPCFSLPLPDLIDQIKPSVVVVGTFSKLRSPPFLMRGTGFVVGDGLTIATNAHVVPERLDTSGGEVVAIQTNPGTANAKLRVARSRRVDTAHDLALLTVDGERLAPVTLGGDELVREGQGVGFVGFPIGAALGLSPVTHRGIVSAITPIVLPSGNASQLNAKVIASLRRGSFEIYQLDGTAYPGNSGGPLFDIERGTVVGLINMVFVKGTKESALSHPSGVSFAIPIRYLRDLMNE